MSDNVRSEHARKKRRIAPQWPGLEHERALAKQGHRLIAGIDEAGRGAWAGPVYAAAALLPVERPDLVCALRGVKDSKQLSARRREALFDIVDKEALSTGVGTASAEEIDALGIAAATRLAMARALENLSRAPEALIIDYVKLPDIALPQRSLPKADQRCLSVAAASIVAKVSRDRYMVELDKRYPGYGFAQHKGYGTAAHRWALSDLGPSPVHRMSWAPLRVIPQEAAP
jgi:ribonuclease HII